MSDFPKWVNVHPSQITRKETSGYPESISVVGYAMHHVARDGTVSVLCETEEDEKRAMFGGPKQKQPPFGPEGDAILPRSGDPVFGKPSRK